MMTPATGDAMSRDVAGNSPPELLSSQVHGLADGNTADNSNTIRDVRGSARRDSIGAVPATTTGASPLTHDCFSGGDVGQHPAFDDRTNCSLSTTSSTETLPRMRTEAPVELPQSMIERKAQKQRKKARNEPLLYMVQGTAKETYPETKESASVADWLRNSSTISYLRTNAPLDCAATDPSSKEIVYSVWQAQRHEARHRAEVAEDTQEEKDAEREDRTEKETEEENVERLEKRRDIHFTPYLPRPAEMVALVERERKRTGGIPEAEREPIECTRTGCPGALVDIKVPFKYELESLFRTFPSIYVSYCGLYYNHEALLQDTKDLTCENYILTKANLEIFGCRSYLHRINSRLGKAFTQLRKKSDELKSDAQDRQVKVEKLERTVTRLRDENESLAANVRRLQAENDELKREIDYRGSDANATVESLVSHSGNLSHLPRPVTAATAAATPTPPTPPRSCCIATATHETFPADDAQSVVVDFAATHTGAGAVVDEALSSENATCELFVYRGAVKSPVAVGDADEARGTQSSTQTSPNPASPLTYAPSPNLTGSTDHESFTQELTSPVKDAGVPLLSQEWSPPSHEEGLSSASAEGASWWNGGSCTPSDNFQQFDQFQEQESPPCSEQSHFPAHTAASPKPELLPPAPSTVPPTSELASTAHASASSNMDLAPLALAAASPSSQLHPPALGNALAPPTSELSPFTTPWDRMSLSSTSVISASDTLYGTPNCEKSDTIKRIMLRWELEAIEANMQAWRRRKFAEDAPQGAHGPADPSLEELDNVCAIDERRLVGIRQETKEMRERNKERIRIIRGLLAEAYSTAEAPTTAPRRDGQQLNLVPSSSSPRRHPALPSPSSSDSKHETSSSTNYGGTTPSRAVVSEASPSANADRTAPPSGIARKTSTSTNLGGATPPQAIVAKVFSSANAGRTAPPSGIAHVIPSSKNSGNTAISSRIAQNEALPRTNPGGTTSQLGIAREVPSKTSLRDTAAESAVLTRLLPRDADPISGDGGRIVDIGAASSRRSGRNGGRGSGGKSSSITDDSRRPRANAPVACRGNHIGDVIDSGICGRVSGNAMRPPRVRAKVERERTSNGDGFQRSAGGDRRRTKAVTFFLKRDLGPAVALERGTNTLPTSSLARSRAENAEARERASTIGRRKRVGRTEEPFSTTRRRRAPRSNATPDVEGSVDHPTSSSTATIGRAGTNSRPNGSRQIAPNCMQGTQSSMTRRRRPVQQTDKKKPMVFR